MELCGLFPDKMIDQSRKKDYYFDAEYSPYLIEDPKQGILRMPNNITIQEIVPSEDSLFLDFISHCLVLDPEERPTAATLMKHPWIDPNAAKSESMGGGSSNVTPLPESPMMSKQRNMMSL